MAWKRVDFPTFASPTMPLFRLLPGRPRRIFSSLAAFFGAILGVRPFEYVRTDVGLRLLPRTRGRGSLGRNAELPVAAGRRRGRGEAKSARAQGEEVVLVAQRTGIRQLRFTQTRFQSSGCDQSRHTSADVVNATTRALLGCVLAQILQHGGVRDPERRSSLSKSSSRTLADARSPQIREPTYLRKQVLLYLNCGTDR